MRLYLTLVQSKCDQNFISRSPLAWWSKGCRCWRQSAKVLQNLKIFFKEEKYIFMDCFTVERLMIPLNIRHHTFHVHRAVKTVKCNEIRAYVCRAHTRKMMIFTVVFTNLAVSPSLSVKFFITLLILGKPQVFPARNTISLIISIYFHSLPNNKGHTLKRIRLYSSGNRSLLLVRSRDWINDERIPTYISIICLYLIGPCTTIYYYDLHNPLKGAVGLSLL